MDKFELLCLLEAISNYAYDIHYTADGRFFFSDHLFSERLADIDIKDDFIETFFLGESQDAPESAAIARKVADLTPVVGGDTQANFKKLRDMIVNALIAIENYKGTKGEEDLLGSVAHILQRHNGLLYRQLTYKSDELQNDDGWQDIVTPEDTAQTLENNKIDANGCHHDEQGKFCEKEEKSDNADGNNSLETEEETEEQSIESVIDKAKNNPSEYEKVDLGEVSERLKQDAVRAGFDLSGYSHNIDVSGVRHAFLEHGDAKKEEKRGQQALTEEDIKRIPEIVKDYEKIEFPGKNGIGRDIIKYTKKFDDGTTYYLEEIRTGKKRLTIQTMYKNKSW